MAYDVMKRRLRDAATRLRSDARGAIAVPLALALPVLFGFLMLAIDGGRYFNLQTSLQAGADALALAGAAELDTRPDAITRAQRAIADLVRNDSRFGNGPLEVASITFYTSLPAAEATAVPASSATSDPALARFVDVRVKPVGFTSLFASAAQATSAPTQTTASAIAGFDSVACNVTPLFMCNPLEGASKGLLLGAEDLKGKLIAMKAKGSQYGSGTYGYLEPAYGNGASAVKEALAIDKPKGCYKQSGVELQPGNISSTAEALNVRFDLYAGNFAGRKGDVAYRPAQNVRKGYSGASCNAQQLEYDPAKAPTAAANTTPPKPLGFPRDNCFYTGPCTYGGSAMAGRVGDGNWDFETYWRRTYGALAFPNGWSNANRPARYEVYRHEIDNYDALVKKLTVNATKPESGAPICYTGGASTLSDDPDRRSFVGAIIDCQAHASQLNGSSGGAIPVTAYGKFFLTEPMDKNDGTIWTELVEIVEPGTAAARHIIRDTVQLYR